MPIYFTGQTGPALPLNSVQYNSGPGQFAGDANLTWVPASGLTINTNNGGLFVGPGTFPADFIGTGSVQITAQTLANGVQNGIPGNFAAPLSLLSTIVTTGDASSVTAESYFDTIGTINHDLGRLNGLDVTTYITVASAKTLIFGVSLFNGTQVTGPGAVTEVSALEYLLTLNGGAVVAIAEGVILDTPDISGGATLGQYYHIRGQDVAGITTSGAKGFINYADKFVVDSAGQPSFLGSNGQAIKILTLSELTTIAAAATTDTAIQIPANAVVFGVDVRVTVAIPTAATFTVIGAGSATVFNTAAVTVAANSTNQGTKSCPFYNATAQAIRITPDIQPGANTGRLRVTIHYYEVTAATS